jgi:hypothetical protein
MLGPTSPEGTNRCIVRPRAQHRSDGGPSGWIHSYEPPVPTSQTSKRQE